VGLAALVNPTGPGHIAPVDVIMLGCVFAVLLWALARPVPVRLPYVWPTLGLMATGLLAGMFSVLPSDGLQAVVQEIFLLLWCAAVATACSTPRALALVLRVWAGSAIAWGGLLVVAVATGQKWLSGAGTVANGTADLSGVSEGTRARLFFDHPNMAGNYFAVAVFIVLASGFPRRVWARWAGCVVLAVAIFLTGSNAAMLSFVLGSLLTLALHLRARKGVVTAAAVTLVLAGLLGVGWVEVVSPFLTTASQSSNDLVRNSVGRGIRSAEARQSLFASQLQIFEQGDLLGIGPAVTKSTLDAEGAAAVHEAHNDYLGTLVERGPLGLTAVLALVGVTVVRLARFTTRPLPPRLAAVLPMPAALGGACLVFAATALTHEILHYRWLWTLLGVVAAVYLLAGETPHAAGSRPRAPDDVVRRVPWPRPPVPRAP
jgi:O-antigen ligase